MVAEEELIIGITNMVVTEGFEKKVADEGDNYTLLGKKKYNTQKKAPPTKG